MFAPFARAALVAPLLLLSTLARADDVMIDKQVFATPKASVTIEGLKATGSSLSREDIVKMLSPDTPSTERARILNSFKARRLAAPTIRIEGEGVVVSVRDVVLDKIEGGRFDKLAIAGAQGTGPNDLALTVNPITAEKGDYSALINAAMAGDPKMVGGRVGTFASEGFTATFRETGPKERAGLIDMSLESLSGATTSDGDVALSSDFALKRLVIAPREGAKLARDLKSFGYDKLDWGMTGSSAYDPTMRRLTIKDVTISGVDIGALSISGELVDLDKTYASSTQEQAIAAYLASSVARSQIKIVNSGLFERALTFLAGSRSPESVRQQWAQAAGQIIPMAFGGDAAALKIAAAVQAFIVDPKNLTLTATGKAGPVPLRDIAAIKELADFLAKVDLTASANQ